MEDVQLKLTDRISNLPDDVTETILVRLPIRDAVRSSNLSRKWRHVWTKHPQLVLDQTLWDNVANGKNCAISTLKKVLYQLLLCHDGPINKFTLSYRELGSCTEIDNLIFFLAKSHLQDFTLEMWKDCYSLPYSILLCQELRHMRLRLCSIKSFASVGFSRLTSLELIEVTISAETLARLVSGSPLLDTLVIENNSNYIDICIDAPNLRTLEVDGLINSIDFRRVPNLDWLSIYCNPEYDDIVDFGGGVGRNITKFFDCLVSVETLQLTYHVAKSFGDEVPKRLPTSLIHLEDLSLYDIGFNTMVDLSFTICLLRSSPNLKYLVIRFEDYPDSTSKETTSYMKGEDYSDISLSELRVVKLGGVTGTKPELEFIKLLLGNSLRLKKIQIESGEDVVDNGLKILKEVTKFRRISKEAELIFDE